MKIAQRLLEGIASLSRRVLPRRDNGYADLVAAAKGVRRCAELAPWKEFDVELAAKFVAEHAPQLAAARAALKRPCRVEMRMTKEMYTKQVVKVDSLRELSKLFGTEAWLAYRQQEFDRLVRAGIDLLELGNATRRGGMLLDALVAMESEGSGVSALRQQRLKLSDGQQQTLIAELQRIDREREPIEENITRDREWEILTGYVEPEEFEPFDSVATNEEEREVEKLLQEMFRIKHEAKKELPPEQKHWEERSLDFIQHALLRLLSTDLALRRFQTAERVFPNQLRSLVPKFLPAVPLDPFTGVPLIYRLQGETFQLYSTGPKRVDGGGSFTSYRMVSRHQGDLCLDVCDIPDPENVSEIAQEISRGS